jgi:phenylacetate-CoA ligase
VNGYFRRAINDAWLSLGGHTRIRRRTAELEQAYTGPEHALVQQRRLRLTQLLLHAIDTVPFYNDLKSLHQEIKSNPEAALAKFPVIDKATLRSNFDQMLSTRPDKHTLNNTSGGSTGEPVRFIQDVDYRDWAEANKNLFSSWIGHRTGDCHIKIWGAPRDIFGGGKSWKKSLRNFAVNETILNCYRVGPSQWDEFTRILNRLRPSLLESYADAGYEYARYLLDKQHPIHKPRGIITSAGLLLPHMKRTIAKAFNCPVLNRYGSREVGDIACSCPQSESLHVSELTHFVEIVTLDNQPCPAGVEGELQITVLTNRSMPLIRYRIEDRATWDAEPCQCERHTKMLASIAGRSNDYLIAVDGSQVNGTALTTLLYEFPEVRRFQFRQASDHSIAMLLEPQPGIAAERFDTVSAKARAKMVTLLGDAARIETQTVKDIPPTPTGKHRYVVNELLTQTLPAS